MRRPGDVVLATALALGMAAAGAEPTDPRLEQLRQAIEAQREQVAEWERRQRGLLEALERIDRTAALLAREVTRARREALEARQDLARSEALAAEIAPRLARTRRAMAQRAATLYKLGDVGLAKVLFDAGDLQDLFARMDLLRRLLASDRRILERYRRQQRQLEAAREAARQAAGRQEEARALARRRAEELATERARKRTLLARVSQSRAHERAALGELEAAARALEETLSRLRGRVAASAAPRGGPPFGARRGKLPPPVNAPIDRPFGRRVDPEFRTQVFRKGVDFEAPLGTPVRAVAPGAVRLADWFRGYGRVVILEHGDGYFTVSGHLAEIRVAVGQRVEEGQVVGTVGESGSLVGPRLYFEVRRGGEALDPRQWLMPAKAG